MIQESENSAAETNVSAQEQSIEHSPEQPQNNNPFIPNMPLPELEATWNMLAGFKQAVRNNTWAGDDVEAVAMGIRWVSNMEVQYRSRLDMARAEQRNAQKAARQAIHAAGGQIKENGNGEKPN